MLYFFNSRPRSWSIGGPTFKYILSRTLFSSKSCQLFDVSRLSPAHHLEYLSILIQRFEFFNLLFGKRTLILGCNAEWVIFKSSLQTRLIIIIHLEHLGSFIHTCNRFLLTMILFLVKRLRHLLLIMWNERLRRLRSNYFSYDLRIIGAKFMAIWSFRAHLVVFLAIITVLKFNVLQSN